MRRSFLLCTTLIASVCADDLNRPDQGWHWYEDPEQTTSETFIQKPPLDMPTYQEQVKKALNTAILNPTSQNVLAYLRQQKELMDRSEKFSTVWQQVVLQNPDLNPDIAHPTAQKGRHVYLDQKKKDTTRWRHTFDCLQKGDRKSEARAGSGAPYCLDGRCVGRDYEDNTEFGEAISKLSILDSIQRDLRVGLTQLFQGVRSECSKDITNCRDCCFTLSGWGISLHLMACSSAEKMLAEKRSKGLCHFVGTYCSQRLLGLCVRKKSSFCCFKSKLGRILNEQGRSQLGKGWGSAQSPDCNGLTVEEIMRLDFSRLDLSELYEDWMKKYQDTAPEPDSVTDRVKGTLESVSDSMAETQDQYERLKR